MGKQKDFIPSSRKQADEKSTTSVDMGTAQLPDGRNLYMSTCSACHQADGSGLPGAFPSLSGSAVVNEEDPEMLIRIILQGYDARAEFAQMPGFSERLSDEEIAAIANHERSSWGNNAPAIASEDVKKIRDFVSNNKQ
jgi:cytochrome c oxidase cbb3-type subunit 2